MSVTVDVDEDRRVRVTDVAVEPRPPDRIDFEVEGTVTITEALLGELAGATLEPARIEIASGEQTVEIDLAADAALRLETVDVGVETPGTDVLSSSPDVIDPSADAESAADTTSADGGAESDETRPGSIAFTVDGTIVDASEETLDAISSGSPNLESLTFAVEGPVRSDGGTEPGDDVIFEWSLFGYGIVIRRSGTIVVGDRDGLATIDLP